MASKRNKASVVSTQSAVHLAPTSHRFWRPQWLFAIALAVCLVVFGPAMNGTFIFDDFHLPFAHPNAAEQPPGFWIGGVRPMLSATYWMNFLISGTHPFSYHLLNVALHAATAVLVFLILKRLLAISGTADGRFYALAGAALFLVHPLQTEPVNYLAGRSELVAGIFFCAAWLVFLNHFETETSFWTSLKILFLAALAVLGKESAISLPAILMATDFFWSTHGFRKELIRRRRLYIPIVFGGVFGSILILRQLTGPSAAGFSFGITPFEYALTQCRVILIYLRLFVLPVGQNGDWSLQFFHSWAADGAWLYVLALLMLIAATVRLFFTSRLLSFGIVIFLLMLAPTSSFVPIKDALAERRLYLPIIGLILVILTLAIRSPLSRNAQRTAAACVLIAAAWFAWQRSVVWTGDLAFWQDSTRKNPVNPRAHLGFGSALTQKGRYGEAIREFQLARSEDSSDQQIVWNLAAAYQLAKQPQESLRLFRSTVAVHPTAAGFNRIGYLEATLGNVTEAVNAFTEAVKLDPTNADAYAFRGTARLSIEDDDGAGQDFRRALELDPGNPTAQAGLKNLAAK